MKYRIVKFQDANEEEYYEIWTAKITAFSKIFGLKWKSEKESIAGTPFYRPVRYNNLNQAHYAIRAMKIEQLVIEEGEIK